MLLVDELLSIGRSCHKHQSCLTHNLETSLCATFITLELMLHFLFITCTCTLVQLGYGSKGNHIHYSGPLLAPAGKVDQMLKEHDRHIQEAARRARLDKAKLRRVQDEGNQISTNSLFISGR